MKPAVSVRCIEGVGRDRAHGPRILAAAKGMWNLRPLLIALAFGLAAGKAAAAGSALFEQLGAQYRQDYGIELVADLEPFPVAEAGGAIEARNAGAKNADMVLYFLRKEFAKYPAEAIRGSGLKRIVFCRDLKVRGHRVAGVALESNGTIYMDSSTEVGDEAHRRRTLHHEFFHFLDYAMHAGRDLMDNPAWAAANTPGTAYGGAGGAQPVPNWASHPAPGFVSVYALKSVPEDRAELFAAIMTNNLTVRLLLQKDKYLTAKLAVLKDELKVFCPQLDEAFWTRTAKNF